MERVNFYEDLCEKCRGLPWHLVTELSTYRPIGNNDRSCKVQSIDHHKSLCELQNSAKAGCRTCQIFWLYIIAKSKAKADDDTELKFTWESLYGVSQIVIENSLQSFTDEEYSRMEADLEVQRLQFLKGSQTKRDFGDLQFPRRQYDEDTDSDSDEDTDSDSDGEYMTDRKFATCIPLYDDDEVDPKGHFFYDDLGYTMQNVVNLWVDDCVKNHPGCREIQQLGLESCAPTRLIDVGVTNKETVKLVDTGGLSKPRYLILSYCWGASNDKSKTTQANIGQRRVSIQIAALPKTIRDAIAITRLMGVQYLWIDSICIIQQDEKKKEGFLDDWKNEAAKMASYYSNALCCISNLGATDSSEGFLREEQAGCRQEERQRKFRRYIQNGAENFAERPASMWRWEPQCNTIYLPRRIEDWHTEWENSSLMRRAWALQEWILSPRILHCTKVGMFMECGRGVCQPNDPFTRPVAREWHRTEGNEISNILRTSTKAQVGDLWMKLVTFYSAMNLTDPTDRLVAFDGIVRLLRAKYNVGYFAGVLSSHIAQTLLWRLNKPRDEVNPAITFPSWSWSTTTNVTFPQFRRCRSYVSCRDDGCFLPSDKVVDYADPSTRLFQLRGPVFHLPAIIRNTWPLYQSGGNYCDGTDPSWRGKDIYFYMDSTKDRDKLDTYDDKPEQAELFERLYLLVCLADVPKDQVRIYRSEKRFYGLILEKVKDTGIDAFQRIGFSVFAERCCQDFDEGQHIKFEEWVADINLI